MSIKIKNEKLKDLYENKIVKFTPLVKELVKKNIKLQYRSSILGVFWTFLQPLLTMIVLSFVFTNLFGKDSSKVVNYSVYLLSGRLLFDFYTQSTKKAMRSIRQHASIIKKVYVPKLIYPISTVFSNFVTFLISLTVLVVVTGYFNVMNINPVPITHRILYIIAPIIVLLILNLGVSLILATVNVFFKDVENIYEVFCLLLFYMTPVIYTLDTLGFKNGSLALSLLKLNPLYGIIDMFRACVLFGNDFVAHFDVATITYSAAFSVVSLVIGLIMFRKAQDKFILHI